MATQPRTRRYQVLDVFGTGVCTGNPLAVVVDGDDLSTETMQAFANWTNLSETTFLLPPSAAEADYRVRIFTPGEELPFAGHPTLGSCRAWLRAGHRPRVAGRVMQECAVGLVPIEVGEQTQEFQAPDLLRSGPVQDDALAPALEALGLDRSEVVEAQWVDNGPGWLGILLDSVERLHALTPAMAADHLGLLAFYDDAEGGGGSERTAGPRYDVRAFFEADGAVREDPVTGSLQAGLAQWMLESGRVTAPYTTTQGQVLGRRGQASIRQDDQGGVWVGGSAVTQIEGTVLL